jgi:hypothetical protein
MKFILRFGGIYRLLQQVLLPHAGFLLGLLFDPEDRATWSSEMSVYSTGLHGVISQKIQLFKIMYFLADCRLLWRLTVYINSVLGWLHPADLCNVADVSDVLAASIWSVEVCGVGYFLCVYIGLCLEERSEDVGGWWPFRAKRGSLLVRTGYQSPTPPRDLLNTYLHIYT